MWNPEILKGYDLAKEARLRAHAPYSQFLVGAAFKLKGSDKFVQGCNVENASFGGTVCAERVAIGNWISQGLKRQDLEFVVIVTDTPENNIAGPCGFCLQVMSEFVGPNFPVYLANLKDVQKKTEFGKLLPMVFKL